MIRKEKWEALRERMEALGIEEDDLVEKFILGSGSGGQKVNKTNSCVYLKHEPSGFEVKCQKERGREHNRYLARKELCEKIEREREGKKSAAEQLRAKIRRQKKRRSKRAKEKMLQEKKERGEVKKLRGKVSNEE